MLAVVEARQVEPGPEDPPPRVPRVVELPAAQHADLDLGVEQHEVDGGLERRERGVVLGVEMARVAQLDEAGAPAALDRGAAEVDPAGRRELLAALERRLRGAQRGPHEVRARPRRGEDVREQQALRDLRAVLVALAALRLGGHRLPGRREAGIALGGGVDEVLGAQRPRPAVA